MAFRKVSAKEWKKMGLPTSISTISFGLSKLRKPSTKKEIKDSQTMNEYYNSNNFKKFSKIILFPIKCLFKFNKMILFNSTVDFYYRSIHKFVF